MGADYSSENFLDEFWNSKEVGANTEAVANDIPHFYCHENNETVHKPDVAVVRRIFLFRLSVYCVVLCRCSILEKVSLMSMVLVRSSLEC